MLDLVARGAQGHGPVHLLLTSAAELGFAWDGGEQGSVRASLPPLRMMTGPTQHYYSSILEAWQCSFVFLLSQLRGRGFGVLCSWMSKALYNYLTLLT